MILGSAGPKLKADSDIPRVELNCSVDVRKSFNSDLESSNRSGVSNTIALVWLKLYINIKQKFLLYFLHIIYCFYLYRYPFRKVPYWVQRMHIYDLQWLQHTLTIRFFAQQKANFLPRNRIDFKTVVWKYATQIQMSLWSLISPLLYIKSIAICWALS